jgi:5'-3' exonuclease
VIINTDVVGDYKEKFEEIYEVDMLPFKKRSTSEYIDEVKPYTELIEKINSKLRNLPNFSINKKDK